MSDSFGILAEANLENFAELDTSSHYDLALDAMHLWNEGAVTITLQENKLILH